MSNIDSQSFNSLTDNEPVSHSSASSKWVRLIPIALEWIQLLFVGLLLDLLLFSGTEVLGPLRLGCIAALLVGVLKGQGWFLLLAFQISLATRETRLPEVNWDLGTLLYCATALTLITYTAAGKQLRSWLARQTAELIMTALELPQSNLEKSSDTGAQAIDLDAKTSRIGWIKFMAIRAIAVLSLSLLTMLLMRRLPITSVTRLEWLKSSIANDFTIWPGATMIVLALLMVIVFTEMSWRQMTVGQGRVYLRSTFFLGHFSEMRMIANRRLKAKRTKESVDAMQKRLTERLIDAPPKDN